MCRLRHIIAATSEFQTWVGVSTTLDALDSIHIAGVTSPTRPFGLISIADFSFTRFAGGSRDWLRDEGTLRVLFEADIDSGNLTSQEAAENAFLTDVGEIMSAATDLSGSGTYLAIESVELEDVTRSAEDEADDYYQARCLVRWRA